MMQELIGQSLGRYQIVALLGEGGMGAVFRGRDLTLQREVAIKVMQPQMARLPDFQQRFLQEARSAARLNHPGIVKVHDFGQARGFLYIVMELLPGSSLRRKLSDLAAARGTMPLPEALQLVRQVCLAVHAAHRHGILHRDIKPDNIVLRPEPAGPLPYQPVLTDLGLAKLLEGGMLTQEGTSLGTPAYMSPEQALGEKTDARSDVYSLGILLYELATGRLPFPIRTLTEAIRYHTKEPPPPPRSIRAGIPELVERIILQALEKSPGRRFGGAGAMADALQQTLASLGEAGSAVATAGAPDGLPGQYRQSVGHPHGTSGWDGLPQPPADPTGDRIAILAPDGTARWQAIASPEIAIGRDAANDLVLEGSTVSRRHALVRLEGHSYQVIDQDSTNGTFLGETRLLPGVPQVWSPGTALRIGAYWLRLELPQQPASDAGRSADDGTVVGPVTARSGAGTRRIAAFMESTELAVDPGSATTASVTILNQGPVVDHFQVSIANLPPAWVPAAPPLTRLLPGSQQQVSVVIQPPRSPESRAGTYPLTIRVTSQDAPDQVAEISATLVVSAYLQFDAQLRPQKQSGPIAGNFRLQASNLGNAELALALSATDPEEACDFSFDPPQPTVAPGGEAWVQLGVEPKSPLSTEEGRTYPFTVTVRPAEGAGQPRQVHGQWVHMPPQLELSLEPPRQSGPAEGAYKVQLTSTEGTDLTVRLEAADPDSCCEYKLEPAQLVVPAGQQRSVALTVRPKAPLAGQEPVNHAFTVTARIDEAPRLARRVQGEWQQAPAPALEATPPQRVGCGFWMLWALLTALGGGLGGTLGLLVNLSQPVALVGWAVVGVCIGTAQWLVLQRRVRRSRLWILANVAGWAVVGPLTAAGGVLEWAIVAALLGIPQWLVLRGQVRGAGVWILAAMLGWGAGGSLAAQSGLALAVPWGWVIAWTAGSAICGVITGLPLVWLLRNPVPQAQPA